MKTIVLLIKNQNRGESMFRRLKRTRLKAPMRALVRETRLDKEDFIYPLFVIEGQGIKNEVTSMPQVAFLLLMLS